MSKYIYRPLKDDGADFKCSQCGERHKAGEMVVLEDTELALGQPGFRQVCCNNGWCVDVRGLERGESL